jgi:hypothetical protein
VAHVEARWAALLSADLCLIRRARLAHVAPFRPGRCPVLSRVGRFVGKKTALTSAPYSKVTAVAYVSDKSLPGSSSPPLPSRLASEGLQRGVPGSDKAPHTHDVWPTHHTMDGLEVRMSVDRTAESRMSPGSNPAAVIGLLTDRALG